MWLGREIKEGDGSAEEARRAIEKTLTAGPPEARFGRGGHPDLVLLGIVLRRRVRASRPVGALKKS
jgi:hypothetical protein